MNKLIRFFFGLFLCGVSIVIAINANIGLGPWNAFDVGLTKHTPFTVGVAGIVTGFVILVIAAILGQIPGWGTIINMVFVGICIDVINAMDVIPKGQSLMTGILMTIVSCFMMGIGIYFYLGAELGAGPRDGLMTILIKKWNKPLWMIRNGIEAIALILGALMGGPIGIGTIIYVFGIGYAIQCIFSLFHFDTNKLKHRSILDDYHDLKNYLRVKQKNIL